MRRWSGRSWGGVVSGEAWLAMFCDSCDHCGDESQLYYFVALFNCCVVFQAACASQQRLKSLYSSCVAATALLSCMQP